MQPKTAVFSCKNRRNQAALKVLKDLVSLLVCNVKKFRFCVSGFFVGYVISRVGFRPLWRRLPGPRHQTQDGSILLMFLVETSLKSESFKSLIVFLRFLAKK